MSAKHGRLYTHSTGEGGADVSYDGAHPSAFESANKNKPSTEFAQAKPRFSDPQPAGPEVDVKGASIADAVKGKASANFAAQKPRFQPEDPQTPDPALYQTNVSDFDKAAHNSRPSPMMTTPTKAGGRSDAWIVQQDHVDTPPAADKPGAFDIKNKPSTFMAANAQRFKGQYDVASYGDPGASESANKSEFAAIAANTKPSINAAAKSDRFKASYEVSSYGDPGAHRSQADIERDQLQAKIARQKAQTEAVAQRDLAKYGGE